MKNPNYGNLGDHTEAVQLDFDPERITYAELLAVFWKTHEAGSQPGSRQYMNAVFYHDEGQRRQALAAKESVERQAGAPVRSEIVSVGTFYLAEDYHQKYLLKNRLDMAGELYRIYPREEDLIASTAAARINGYAGGHGTADQLAREIDSLGLSPKGRRSLTEWVHRQRRGFW